MCTLVLLHRPGELLCVSGNRNELLARPASGPRFEDGIVAPRDLAAHGTWLGLNQHGLFVCLTNRKNAVLDARRVSRGLLVLEALRAPSARALHERLAVLPGDRHNGFHLVYADLAGAFVTFGDGVRTHQLELAPGEPHVITERSFGAGEGARERAARAAFAGLAPGTAAWRAPMTAHASEPLESACVHADPWGYGTRSSLQLILRAAGGAGAARTSAGPESADQNRARETDGVPAVDALWTDGHPCTNPARDLGALFAQALAQRDPPGR